MGGGGGKEGKEEERERCYESSEYDGQWYVFSRASHFTVNFTRVKFHCVFQLHMLHCNTVHVYACETSQFTSHFVRPHSLLLL